MLQSKTAFIVVLINPLLASVQWTVSHNAQLAVVSITLRHWPG